MGSCHGKQPSHKDREKQFQTTKHKEIVLEPIQLQAQVYREREGSQSVAFSQPLPPNHLRGTALSELKLNESYGGSFSTISDSLRHMGSYEHVLNVRAPSELQDSGRVAGLQDSSKIWELVNPEVQLAEERKIRMRYQRSEGLMQYIREEASEVNIEVKLQNDVNREVRL